MWNEHNRRYRPETIGGDFGNVQIVLSPRENGLVAVDLYTDQGVSRWALLLRRG